MRKQLGVLLLVLAIAIGFSGAVAAQPVYKQATYPQKTVSIYNFAFHPHTLTVKVGTTVTWRNIAPVSHTVTSYKGKKFKSSGILNSGARYKYTFTKTGKYYYYCKIHPYMKGVIVVRR